jgi:c(7)-type cytochrome triheme protein
MYREQLSPIQRGRDRHATPALRPAWRCTGARLLAAAVLALGTMALLLTACSAQPPKALTAILDPLPPARDVVHKPRHPPYQPPSAPIIIKVTKAPPPTDWPAQLELLPKDAAGGTDWVGALNGSLITPKPGVDPKEEEQPVLDMDLELVPKDSPDFKVVYPHKIHTTLLACTTCHTAIFQMEKGADPITMEKIFAGEYCGRCHGKVAFDPITACARCHVAMPK